MKKLFSFLTLALGAFPILKLNHFSILMILWFIVAVYLFLQTKTYKKAFFSKESVLIFCGLSFLFWVYLFSFPFASDTKEMGKIIVKSLPIFVFSFGFLIAKSFLTKQTIRRLLNVYLGSTILVNVFGWIQIFRQGFSEVFKNNDFYHPTIRLIFSDTSGIHIPYLGLMSAFAALLLVYRLVYLKEKKILSIVLILFLFISMYVYSARMALGIFICGLIFTLFQSIKSKVVKYSVLIGVSFLAVLIIWFSPIKERYQRSLNTEWILPHEGQQPHEVNYRYGISYCSLEILKDNIWFGVGPSEVQKSLNNCYKSFTYKSYEDFSQVTYNTHNQYMDFLLKYGSVLGVLLILSLFYFIPKSDLIYQIFILTICLSFLTENVLDRQMGVVFFSLFNAIFVFYKKETLEKNTCG